MTVYNQLAEWSATHLMEPRLYAELGVPDLSWIGTKSTPNTKTITDYEYKRVEPAEGTLLGSSVTWVSPGMEPTTRAVVHHRYGLSVNRENLEMAGQAGFDLLGQQIKGPLKQMQLIKAQIVFQGTTASRDKVSLSGMFDLGEDTNSGLDDDPWDTAGNPFTHVKEGAKDLISNGYEPPYTMIMGYKLLPGFFSLHNAAGGLTEANLAFGTGIPEPTAKFIDRAIFASEGTDASNVVYPLPDAANDDSVWILTKPSLENYYIGMIRPLTVGAWEYNRTNNSYEAIMEERWSFVVRDGASIVYEPDVDLA